MRLMTMNIRFSGANDGENSWDFRRDFCSELISKLDPDIIGFQELCEDQFEFLNSNLEGYASYGLFSNGSGHDPHGKHPLNNIYYKRTKFALLTGASFCLSETPHIPKSISWDNSSCARRVTWVQLVEKKSGREFRFINTHLDHIGKRARTEQAKLIFENANAYNKDYPQFLTGDMNCDANSPAIKSFLENGWKDTYSDMHGTLTPGFTYHTFKGESFDGDNIMSKDIDKIDWIFYRGAASVKNAEIIKDSKNGKFPSDHYFVLADVELGS